MVLGETFNKAATSADVNIVGQMIPQNEPLSGFDRVP